MTGPSFLIGTDPLVPLQDMGKFTYLVIDLLSVAFPLLASFEQRISFWRKWRGLFQGILVMMLLFIPWDVLFTAEKIWGFNDEYLVGIAIAGLPIEEWFFFLLIPYACMFLYEVMRYFIPKDVLDPYARAMAGTLAGILLVVGLIHFDRAYTTVTFLLAAIALGHHAFIARTAWLGRFFIGYAISLVPFFLVNGILTGTFLDRPVVWYNDMENLGIRLGTIPIEDAIYLMLLLLIVTTFYERKR